MKNKILFNIFVTVGVTLIIIGVVYNFICRFGILQYSSKLDYAISVIGYLVFSLTLLISYFLSNNIERKATAWKLPIGSFFLIAVFLEGHYHLRFVRLFLVLALIAFIGYFGYFRKRRYR